MKKYLLFIFITFISITQTVFALDYTTYKLDNGHPVIIKEVHAQASNISQEASNKHTIRFMVVFVYITIFYIIHFAANIQLFSHTCKLIDYFSRFTSFTLSPLFSNDLVHCT